MSERAAFATVLVAVMLVSVVVSGIAYAGSVDLRDAVLGDVPDEQRDIQGTIWFQGYIADSGTGEPVNANYSVVAEIYDSSVDGTTVWGPETHNATPVNDGWFSIELGSVLSPLPEFDAPPYYLQLSVDGELLEPRLKLASVPSAFQSSAADAADDDWVIAGSDVYRMTGDVGIGIASPTARFEVVAGSEDCARFESSGTGSDFTVLASNMAGTAGAFFAKTAALTYPSTATALYSLGSDGANGAFLTAKGGGTGVIAQSHETGTALEGWAYGSGRSGYFHGGSGVEIDGGVTIDTPSLLGVAITGDYAHSFASVLKVEYTASGTYDADAVVGVCVPQDYYGTGGHFTGGYRGVYGKVTPSGSDFYYGVYGTVAGGGGTNYGVYGYGGGSTGTNWAGFFNGNVHVTSTLSKGGGSFKIDHPLDPANQYLYHSFVESPDMMNVYNGNVVLDGAGEAWIEMPEWFDALNRDFRYQLTCIGGFAPVYVAEKMSGNRYRIAGGEPGMEVSWQVTGIRRDRFAEENRIPVEEMKSPKERGKYIHPEVFGLPETMSVSYDARSRDKE